jgi:hypothetical protein
MNKQKTRIVGGWSVVALVMLMIGSAFFPACKKADNYNITGLWAVIVSINDRALLGSLTFTGSETSGTVTDGTSTGIYFVNGDKVSFTFDEVSAVDGRIHSDYSGEFTAEDIMTGTLTITFLDQNNEKAVGEWTCNR